MQKMMTAIILLITKTIVKNVKLKMIKFPIEKIKFCLMIMLKLTAFNRNSKLRSIKNIKTRYKQTLKENKGIFESEHNIIKIPQKVLKIKHKYQKESDYIQNKILNH